MGKKAVDLSIEELAASGAKAARLALQQAQTAGLTVTGLIETFESGVPAGTLAQIHPSGTITLIEVGSLRNCPPSSDRPAVADKEDEGELSRSFQKE